MHRFVSWSRTHLLAALLAALMVCTAEAQEVRTGRAKTALTLMGFESPDAAGHWTGMRCRLSTAHVSQGKTALEILYPKWPGTGDQYLPATIAWADGSGYPVKDWSPYGKLTFDGWIDGDKPLQLTVELTNGAQQKVFTKELVVQPGRRNTFELTLPDVAEAIDLGDITSITIYGIRPTRDTKLTVDDFRLVPAPKPQLAVFDLVYPNYRETVYPGAENVKVSVDLHAAEHGLDGASLAVTLAVAHGKAKTATKAKVTGTTMNVSVPVAKLPAGPATLTASVIEARSGKVLATKVWTIRKATKAEAASTKVYVDEHNNLVADGKPFFPIGWFGNASIDHLEEIADSPFNTILAYGVNPRSKAYITRFLDLVQSHGMKIIYCMNDVYPTATFLDGIGWEGIQGNSKIADAVVKAFRNHPAVLAWYLNDERPKELIPKLEGYYQRIRKNDPEHPCFIVIYQMPEVKYFPTTTDIMGVDRYPIPTEPVTEVSHEMQVARDAVRGHKPAWAVIQAFGWYQYNVAFPDRGRIPTQEELRSGRAPSFDEDRCMTYLALVHGAKGLLYYCYYDMRVLPQYAEMWAGLKKIAAEVKTLSPVLLSPDNGKPVVCSPADAGVETMLKEMDEERYLIAVNPRSTPCKVTFDLKQPPNGKVRVMFEGRYAMDVEGSKLTDSFKPLEVHVYDLGRPVPKR